MTPTVSRRPVGRPPQARPELVAYLWALRDEGLGYRAIAVRLNAENIPTPSGRPHWQHPHVIDLLHTTHAKQIRSAAARSGAN